MTAMISNNMAMAADASANVASQDVQGKLTALGGSKNLSPEAKAKKLREACEGFESIFIQKMWQEMRKTVPQSDLMHGKEEKFWQDMYDQELAKKMTSAGGIGLADMMYEQLSRNLVSASRGTASAMSQQSQRAFVPEAVPLVPETTAVASASDKLATPVAPVAPVAKGSPAMASIYDGAAPVQDHGPAPEANAAEAAQAAAPAPTVAPTVAVDPTLDNAAVSQALAAMRQEQHKRQQNATAPAATPTQVAAADKPVHHEMSPIERTQMVRRDIGDQLGSRGVRNPIKPQTAKAQARTENARAVREARKAQKYASLNVQNAPAAAPEAAQQAQVADSAQASPTVRYTTNLPESQRQNALKRSSTVETTAPNSRAGAGIAAYHEQQRQAQADTTGQAVQAVPPLTAGAAQNTQPAAQTVGGIPPLTVSDLRI